MIQNVALDRGNCSRTVFRWKMYRMATSGEIGTTMLFWSEVKKQWLPLSGVMFDIEPLRLGEMVAAGIQKVKVLGSGQAGTARLVLR